MKVVFLTLLVLSIASAANAQSVAPSQGAPDISVVKYSWDKERIGWEGDPFSGPLENFDEMRARARNEKRIDDAKRGGGSGGVDRVKREARADEANLARQREKVPARYVFVYKALIKNAGTRTVKLLDWDYIFFDRASQTEVGRQQFTSEEKIGPGKTKELQVVIRKPPTPTISVMALNKDERKALSDQVIVVRVEYTDGTVWQQP